MKRLTEIIIKHPVTIIMMTLLLFFGGIIGTMNMSMQLIPDIQIPMISVVVTYPGASAATVEDTVTDKLEDSMQGVSGVTAVNTFSYDNISAVMLTFDFGVDVNEKTKLVEDAVNDIKLPEGCSRPKLSAVDLNGMATATVYVTDKRDTEFDRNVPYAAATADALVSRLLGIEGVGSVTKDGEPEDGVTVMPIRGMESATLLLVQALSGEEYDIPLGDIISGGEHIQIRNLSGVKSTDEIRALPVTLPAAVAASLSSVKSLSEYYERATGEDIIDFTAAVNDEIRPTVRKIDDIYAADTQKTVVRDYAQYKYYVSLLSYPSATLFSLMNSDYYSSLKDATEDMTDGEIYDYLADIEDYAGISVGAETLFMARAEAKADTANTLLPEGERETAGLARLVAFKRGKETSTIIGGIEVTNPYYVYTEDDYDELAVEMQLVPDTEKAAVMREESAPFSRAGLSVIGKRRFFDEKISDADYAELFRGTDIATDYPIVMTEIGMKFVRAESFDANAAFLLEHKTLYPKPSDVESGYLSDAEVSELYNGLDTDGIINYELSDDMIAFIRATDFGGGSALTVKMSDIARVVGPGDDGYVPSYGSYAYYNGVQGVKVSIFAAGGANGTNVVRAVKDIIADMSEHDAPFTIALTDDNSEFISESVSNVLISMLIGGALAVFVIFLFLKKAKPSIIISVTMPLSVLSALLLLFVMGITLNMVSLGGLAVGIGMLVDNSIVVIEAISKRRDAGDSSFRAAVNGTSEVAGALVGSTLTTVCVFIPILFVGGLCAEIFTDLAWAVIWSLTFSLLVAVTVIPTLYSLFSGGARMLKGGNLTPVGGEDGDKSEESEKKMCGETAATATDATADTAVCVATVFDTDGQKSTKTDVKRGRFFKPVVMNAVSSFYEKILPSVISKKIIVVIAALAVFAASIGLLFTTGTEFLPSVDKGLVEISLGYYGGANLTEAETDATALANVIEDVEGVKNISVSVGVQGLLAFNNTGSISVKLDGKRKTEEVTEEIRTVTEKVRADGLLKYTATAAVSEIDGVVEVMTGGMSDLSVTVIGDDPAKLATIAAEIADRFESEDFKKAGFKTVTSSMSDENTTLEYDIDFDMTALAEKNIDYAATVLTLRAGLAGYDAATVTLGGKDCMITVSFSDTAITSYDELCDFSVGTYEGETVKLRDVATVEIVTADTVIKKTDGKYNASVSAEVYRLDSGTAGKMMDRAVYDVLDKIDPETGKSYADGGYEYVSSGVASYLSNAFDGLVIALIVSFFLLFGVMAAQFESVTKPLIIMCAIPFAFTGGFIAIAITRMTLNVVSFVGLIMLMGVIVNNAIVLLEKIKQLHDEGLDHYSAVVEGCTARLRPVLMTTLTTVLALIPLALGIGSGSELMQPLGIVVMGGLIVGTLVTLALIPAVYCMVHGISKSRPNGREKKKSENVVNDAAHS